jgi:nitrous oxidase accessory protein NosD
VEDNDIFQHALAGITVDRRGAPSCVSNRIRDNTLAGVIVHESGAGTFHQNRVFHNAQDGFLIKAAGEPVCRGNVVTDNGRYGVHVTLAGLGLIESNDVFANTKAGIAVTEGGKPIVNHNTVHDEPGPGMVCIPYRLTLSAARLPRNPLSLSCCLTVSTSSLTLSPPSHEFSIRWCLTPARCSQQPRTA